MAGDEVPRIQVEAVDAAGEGDGVARGGRGSGGSGSGGSPRRVVREPRRWSRAAAFAALAVLAAGSLLMVLRGGAQDVRKDGSDEPAPADASDASRYVSAIGRLRRAGSFAYHGTVRAPRASPLRPGAWIGSPVTVEGTVLLPHDITREVAVGTDGTMVETVTSGPAVWTRSAAPASDLDEVAWETVVAPDRRPARPPFPDVAASSRRGTALLVDILRAAGDRRRDDPPAAGEDQTLHATVPADERFGTLLMGADVSVSLDDAGDVRHLSLRSAPGVEPGLTVDLDIERLGEADLITPDDVGIPARRTVPVHVLEAAGIHAVEPASLPAGWALTDARATRPDPVLMCEFGGCSRPHGTCPALGLDYRDLTATAGGRLSLLVMSQRCLAGQGGTPRWRDPFHAGTFTGRAETTSGTTRGTLSDLVTAVGFSTDLPPPDAAAILSSLVPFNAAA